ncbi:MAG: MarR family transcriptional regulator [Methanomicrobiales archaeon]|nr:MarR family transcriptional regulator [Methanomicrobiales archaeon]
MDGNFLEQEIPKVNDKTLDQIAKNLVALVPLFHRKVVRQDHRVSAIQLAGYRVLVTLLREGSLPISEVGRRLYISKPYMTRLADDLLKEGLVERTPDGEDRRVVRLTITGAGERRLGEMGDLFKDGIKVFLSGLDPHDLSTLNESLENLMRIMSAMKEG